MRRWFVIALLLVACGQEQPATTTTAQTTAPQMPPPSAGDARKIIESSPELGDFQFTDAGYSLPVSHSTMNDPQKAAARDLAKAGWIKLDSAGDLTLSDKARNDKRFLLRPNGILDIVPLAKKEMGDVTAVRTNDDGTVTVDFGWKWIANEVGSAFRTGTVADRFAAPQDGRATLMWDGSAWTILKI